MPTGYGVVHSVYLLFSLVTTRVLFKRARLIRLPFYFRIEGRVCGGEFFTAGRSLRIDVKRKGVLQIGKGVQLNDHCQISCAERVEIGDNVLIASKVFISDHDHQFNAGIGASMTQLESAPVCIGKNTWIGNGVSILKGVIIGEGSVVAAGAVVTKSFGPHSVIAGVPAKQIGPGASVN